MSMTRQQAAVDDARGILKAVNDQLGSALTLMLAANSDGSKDSFVERLESLRATADLLEGDIDATLASEIGR